MEFIDLGAQRRRISKSLEKRISTVLDHSKFIMGPEVAELEAELAKFVGIKHCISVANGTDALQIAMMAADIKPGDEIITTAFSFFATVETILLLGAKPVFADINPKTYNLDPTKIESLITARTKVILPVSLYGQCCDLDAINAVAKKHKLMVFEDAAQSFGATYKGKRSCSFTDIACTSFFPTKPLGCYGDGGACFTNNDDLAAKMKMIRVHGQDRRYHHSLVGVNSRLDTIQAAILLAKLEIFEEEIALRQKVAKKYDEALKGFMPTPEIQADNKSVFAQYTLEVEDRDRVQSALQDLGVPTMVHYPIAMNLQPAFQKIYKEASTFSIAESAASRVFSLPFHPYLTENDQIRVADALKKVLGTSSR